MVINTPSFGRFWPVSWTITHRFGVRKRFPSLLNPKVRLSVGHQQSQFGPILACFLDYYLVMGSRNDPGLCLRVGQQHSQFWRILTCFVDYYSLFSGPEVISIVVEPQGVLTCSSSTLAVLANSGPFHGLLLTVLGSQSDFHGCRTPRCAYVLVINTRSFGRFWPVSWKIAHCFGVPE